MGPLQLCIVTEKWRTVAAWRRYFGYPAVIQNLDSDGLACLAVPGTKREGGRGSVFLPTSRATFTFRDVGSRLVLHPIR